MKARVICTYSCGRSCPGCCNKDWKFTPATPIHSFRCYSEILLTGGEPLLFVGRLLSLIKRIRREANSAIYVYTAAIEQPIALRLAMQHADGVCLTLHEPRDVERFDRFQCDTKLPQYKSLRLNVFAGIGFPKDTSGWVVKRDVRWLKDCPLPRDEGLYKLPHLW